MLSEILGPLGLGLLVYTSILLIQTFFRFAETIIRRGIPAKTVGELLLYSLPNIVVLTLPMSLLLGVLLGIGRLASDSELIAIRASGASVYRLMRPILALSLLMSLVSGVLMHRAMPSGNAAVSRLMLEIATKTIGQQLEPGVFYSEFQGKTLFVFDIGPDGLWNGVFLADSVPTERNSVLVAKTGRLSTDPTGERLILRLENAVEHNYDFAHPESYETRKHEVFRTILKDRFASEEKARISRRKNVRSLTFSEYRDLARDPTATPEERNLGRIGMHKMYAIPAACLVLGLLALPLGFTNRRGGKSTGFALSIGIVVVYHVMITQGEDAATFGRISPALAMWLPNLVLGAIGLALVVLRDRDRSIVPSALRRWAGWRQGTTGIARLTRSVGGRVPRLGRRRAEAPTGVSRQAGAPFEGMPAGRIVLRVPRPRLRFPNRLDRYVLSRSAAIFLLVLLSAICLSVIADLTDNVDDILKNQIGANTVLRYYKYKSLQLAYEVLPICALVSTLVVFGLLSRTNEIIAARSLGVSLFRLALPAIFGAALLAGMAAYLQAQILPITNQKVAEANDRIKGRTNQRVIRGPDKQWLFGHGRYLYNFLRFDPAQDRLERLQVFEFDEQRSLSARLLADVAQYTPNGWVLEGGWARTFRDREQLRYEPLKKPVLVDLPEGPSYFRGEEPRPIQMTYGQLLRYVDELRRSGQRRPELEVALQNKLAFPFGTVVMAIVALPFAFRLERRGALYGLGISVVLGMVFMAVYALFKTLGDVGVFPAAVAVWSPAVLFILLASYLFLGVRS